MDDPLLAFVKSVKLTDCRIFNTPNLVFLCGGVTGSDPAPYESARDYFHRYLKKNHPSLIKRVRRAEVINDWFDHDIFSDLLELEEYIAALADLIVLFVESPGSIAELGAFATSTHLRPKTLAIVSSTYQQTGTFIADGPVRRLENENKDLVRYFDWEPKTINDQETLEALNDMSEELAQLLIDREKLGVTEQQLDQESHAHTMLLMADLIDILGITTETEITKCFNEWGYGLDRRHLRQYISLLENLKIIKQLPYSTQRYYVSRVASTYIRYDFALDAKLRDREKVMSGIRTTLPARDPRRSKVFERYLRKMAKKTPAYA
jgi:hypothetical protein